MDALAIIGIGCRFPSAEGPDEFWRLLRNGVDAIREVPAERWDIDALFDPDPDVPGRMSSRWGGFIDHPYAFDNTLFGLSEREARETDPQQRLLLEVAWHALEHAGYPREALRGSRTGVYVGISNPDFGRRLARGAEITPHAGPGNAFSIAANRLSYFLDLRGPSLAIDTACSSSLVALHTACRSLQAGECEMALAGGVNLILTPEATVAFSKARMMAPDGRCKTFDERADGYVRGEGAGVVVLKPLAAAQRDGDRVLAVVRGSAINQDGFTNGLTAPNPDAQEAVLREACAAAGLPLHEIDYVELHGTGTALGDPMEARALGRVVGAGRGAEAPCRVGSVKSNIGHLESAAGIAGLIKLSLSLYHGEIPPSLHFRRPNPRIDLEALGLAMQTEIGPWPTPAGRPRRGGISSFGFGGTNAHAVLESYPGEVPAERAAPAGRTRLLTLSARTPGALSRLAAAYRERFATLTGEQWAGACDTANHRRTRLPLRAAVVANHLDELGERLGWLAAGRPGPKVWRSKQPVRRAPRIAFLFTGQGCHYRGMARGLLAEDPRFRQRLEEADAALRGLLPIPLIELLSDDRHAVRLDDTRYTQPALVAIEVALAERWIAHGLRPKVVLGHSLGEYAAACVAGVFSLEQAVELAARRGEGMARLGGEGAMAAVFASAEEVDRRLEPFSGELAAAVYNGPANTVVAGAPEALDALLATLDEEKIRWHRLAVTSAFHSPLIEPMLPEFREFLERTPTAPLAIPLISNLSGEKLPRGSRLEAGYWCNHARKPVRFDRGLTALAEAGIDLCLEIGPRPVLGAMAAGHPATAGLTCLPSLREGRDEQETFNDSLAALFTAGAELTLPTYANPAAPMVELPLYPFDRRHLAPPDLESSRISRTIQQQSSLAPTVTTEAAPVPTQDNGGGAEIAERVIALVAELLGTTPDRVERDAPFLEMGADSLVLVQAVGRLEREFGVKIQLKQFFDELSAVGKLVDHLEARARAAEAPPHAATVLPVTTIASTEARAALPVQGIAEAAGRHLTPRQALHLRALTARYIQRTAGSKRYAARHRPRLADSRASAGFRFTTKEMLYPIVGARAEGARFWDIDNNEYLDISMGFGVHLLGHEPPVVKEALRRQLEAGGQLGPQAELAGESAALISELTGCDRVVFCNSGTEAVMTALRLARAHTGRRRVALFRGAYHGHSDLTLAEASPEGPAHPAVPLMPGVSPGAGADLMVLEYGEESALEDLRRHGRELAAVLVEPVQSRRPELQPKGFLEALRGITQESGALLIFDEMITGFRIHPGGAQAWFGVTADLATYGKIVGGGLPIGVVAGRGAVMDAIDGGQWRYGDDSFPGVETTLFAGTFNKNPLGMAAAHAMLSEMKRRGPALQERLNERTAGLAAGLNERLEAFRAPICVTHFGSLFRFTFRDNLDLFFYHLLERGIYVWEGRNCFLSDAHDDDDIERITGAVGEAAEALRRGGFIATSAEPDERPTEAPLLPLIPAQRQLWALTQVSPAGAVAYHLPLLVRLQGSLQTTRLEKALRRVIATHEALRTAIDPDGVAQRVLPEVPFTLRLDRADDDEGRRGRLAAYVDEPFDLARPPLLRALLLGDGAGGHELLLVAHHIVMDGLSLQKVAMEIGRAYEGREEPSPGRQFGDFISWRIGLIGTPDWERHRRYWLDRLATPPPLLPLPIDRPPPKVRGFRGERVERALGAELFPALELVCRGRGATPFMGLLTLYAALLQRITREETFLIGVPYAGRGLEGGGEIVGYCTHLLPVPMDLDWSRISFAKALEAVRERLLDAYSNDLYSLAELIDELVLPRDPARPTLINVIFNLDRVEPVEGWGDLRPTLLSPPVARAKFDLGLNLTEIGGVLRAEAEYNAEIFEGPGVARWLEQFERLLRGALEQPEAPLNRLPLATEEELRRLTVEWNDTAVRFPGTPLLHRRILEQAARTPERIAVVTDGERLSYRELARRAHGVAALLLKSGLRPGERVGLALPPEGMVAAMVGAMGAGAAAVALEPETPPGRLEVLTREAGIERLVTAAGHTPPFSGIRLHLEEVTPLDAPPPIEERLDGEAIAYVAFTSGTSGRPKAVAIPHRAVTNYVDGLSAAAELPAAASYAMVSTFAADLGYSALFPALCGGGTLHLPGAKRSMDPEALAEYFEREGIDVLKVVPSHLEALLSAERPHRLIPRKRLILGGEAAGGALIVRLLELRGECRLFNHYGPTEATIGALIGEITDPPPPAGASGEAPPYTPPLRRPLPNLRAYLLDPAGRPLPIGMEGELYLGGAGLARGYLGRPEATAGAFVPNPFGDGRLYRTGDRARFRDAATLELLGRWDDQLKINGYRVEPAEIAAIAEEEPTVGRAFVTAIKGAGGRATLAAYLTPTDGGDAPDREAVRARLDAALPRYMVPRHLVVLEKLPLTANGKIDRRALPAPEAGSDAPSAASLSTNGSSITGLAANSSSSPEEALLTVWRALLKGGEIGLDDDFFALGGDSILAIQMAARLHQRGLRMVAAEIYHHPTIRRLAPRLVPLHRVHADQGRLTGALPAAPIQHWFFEHRPLPNPDHWNMSVMLEMAPDITLDQVRAAFTRLLDRHDALRIRIRREGDGGWSQHYGDAREVPMDELERFTPGQIQRRLNLAEGPPLRLGWRAGGEGAPPQLLIVVHHLVMDGVSWRILLEELAHCLTAARDGTPVELGAKSSAWREWLTRLGEYARSAALDEAREYWATLAGIPYEPLPREAGQESGRGDTVGDTEVVRATLSAERTEALLHDSGRAYNTDLNDLLITALAWVFAEFIDDDLLMVELEGHGREPLFDELDLSRTIGWFTSRYPVWLDLEGAAGPEEALRVVKEQRRRIPDNGLSYGLLRYLGRDEDRARLASMPQPELSFNYLGRFDASIDPGAPFRLSDATRGDERDPDCGRRHTIAVDAMILDGRLTVDWNFSPRRISRPRTERLAGAFNATVEALIDHCAAVTAPCHTPSDFTAVALEQRDLDAIAAALGAGAVAERPWTHETPLWEEHSP